ncbi:MAG TPA: hypothetical protein VE843_04250 [Ktedonobacteraceae bacterium]|nr:hypothetical protein [Ktedonobacteraceae bacterium]
MSKQPAKANEQISSSRLSDTAIYSAHIQEAMRYDKLRPSDYHMAMTIMRAVSQGLTEEKWENEQQATIRVLTNQPPDEKAPHTDAASRYEQTIDCFKDLGLWPW